MQISSRQFIVALHIIAFDFLIRIITVVVAVAFREGGQCSTIVLCFIFSRFCTHPQWLCSL
jgi:hypothetical protein